MAMKKRSNQAREKVSASDRFSEDDRKQARNPFLQGLHQDVYQFVQRNPNSTRDDVSRGIGLKSSTCTARIKELIDEGYLYEPPGHRKANPSGVSAKVLRVSNRPQGGQPLDTVRVEIELTIDCNGVYGARATVVNGRVQTATPHVIKKQRVSLKAPHPDSYKSLLTEEAVARVSRMEVENFGGDIIDAEVISEEH